MAAAIGKDGRQRWRAVLFGAAIIGAVAAPTTAHAAPTSSLPSSFVVYPDSYGDEANDLRLGPDGRWWVPPFESSTIDLMTTAGVVTPLQWRQGLITPRVTAGADGDMYVSTCSPNNCNSSEIDKVSPTGGLLATFPEPVEAPADITLGPDGNVWATSDSTINSSTFGVRRITPAGVVTLFPWPGAFPGYGGLGSITSGPDGNLWFGTPNNGEIGRITPSGVYTIYPISPLDVGTPTISQVTAGPDGSVWYADFSTDEIGRVSPAGVVTQFVMPDGLTPYSITAGPDGNLWFADAQQDGHVGRMTPSGQVGYFDVSSAGPYPETITAGPDGRIWLTVCCSSVAAFQPFAPPTSPPEIRSFSQPYSGLSGGGTVVITGYDVGSATKVLFGSTPATSFHALGPSQLSVTVPPHAVGVVNVTVITPDGTSAASSANQFYYQAAGCGMVITRTTHLGGDIGPCYAGLSVAADNITLDLNGARLFGFQIPRDGTYAGIDLEKRSGVTISGGSVSNFDAGIHIAGGGGNSVANMNVHDNIGLDDVNTQFGDGIMIEHSANNQIVHNVVNHNGVFDGIGVFDPGSDGNVIVNNVVENTIGTSDGGPAGQGIIVNGSTGELGATASHGNRVINNVVRNNGSAGIASINEIGGTVQNNTITGNGATNTFGNGIGVHVGFNWSLGPTRMVVKDNTVSGNGADGIRVGNPFGGLLSGGAEGNTITGNVVTGNDTNKGYDFFEGFISAFDLHDYTPNCGTNVWSRNTWGSAGFSPVCTTSGGSGPSTPSSAAAPQLSAPKAAAAHTASATTTWPNARVWQRFLLGGRG